MVDAEFAHRDFSAASDADRDEQSSFIFNHMLDSRGLMYDRRIVIVLIINEFNINHSID